MIRNIVIEIFLLPCPRHIDVQVEANWLYKIDVSDGEDVEANANEGRDTNMDMDRR